MKNRSRYSLLLFLGSNLILGSFFMTACGSRHDPALNQPTVIENTQGGLDFLEREFGECDPNEIPEEDTPRYRPYQQPINSYSVQMQSRTVEQTFPHQYSSLDEMFPLRGSWRKTKDEILDIVDRKIYDPATNQIVPELKFFDMVLLINVADRQNGDPKDSSAQRMQVLVRNSATNHDISSWKTIETWPISSGNPCGKKVATPTGVFKLDPKEGRFTPEYKSKQFDDANMYETMFLFHTYQNGTPTGVAIHGSYKTALLGRRDSGGCIRLHRDNSKCLFETFSGQRSTRCLSGGELDYRGSVPSFLGKNGEADPEYLSNGSLMVSGFKVLVAIYDDKNDRLD